MGRGTFHLMVAEGIFVLSGWAIHVGAGRILGESQYGIFVLLLSLLTHYRIFLATGVNRAVSKYVSEDPSRLRSVERGALKLQFTLGWALCGLVALLAPALSRLWQRPELTGYIRLTGLFFPAFGLYSVYRGSLNGLKLFGREALVENVYSLLKAAGFFALIFLFRDRLAGAVVGYLVAIVGAIVMARLSLPDRGSSSALPFPVLKIVAFAFPVVLLSFGNSLLQSLDLYFLQALLPAERLAAASSYYGCAQQFAKIPYLLLYALSLTLFPNISEVTAAGKSAEAARTIGKALRAGLFLSLPLACLISALAPGLIRLVYGENFVGGAHALSLLIFGQIFLSFLIVLSTIITAGGYPWISFSLVAATAALSAVANYFLVPGHGIMGAAGATTLAGAIGMAAAALVVQARFGALLRPLSVLRIVLASALLYAAGRLLSPSGWIVLPAAAGLFILYLLLLVLLREIDGDDRKMVLSLLRG
jgi:stage V sporulation protein B